MRQMGIKVLVPDMNVSSLDFTALARRRGGPGESPSHPARSGSSRSGSRRCATSARASSRNILQERDKNGAFVDFYDFCERVDPMVLNKRAIESIVKAGAFDSVGHPRHELSRCTSRSSTSPSPNATSTTKGS